MRMTGPLALVICLAAATAAAAPLKFDAEAVRINNRGVAQMGQQFTERAAQSFAEAFKKDPKLAQAAINEGIALMALQKLDEAKKALQQAIALDPEQPAGVVQPGPGAARRQRTGAGAGQLSAGGQARSAGMRIPTILRASATRR